MRRPKLRLALCVVGLAAVLAGGALALGSGDSLISLSYLTSTFLPSAQSQLEEINNDAMQEAYDQAAAQVQGGAGTGSGLYSADFQSRTFSQGDIITLPTGSGLMIYGGTGELAHSGAVIDVTDGTVVPSGTRLTAGHRYLVGGGHLGRPGSALRGDLPGASGELQRGRCRDFGPALYRCGPGGTGT